VRAKSVEDLASSFAFQAGREEGDSKERILFHEESFGRFDLVPEN
jgi:hypothetical protein